MNERVLELALDSGILIQSDHCQGHLISSNITIEDVNKFADAIIKECINVCLERSKDVIILRLDREKSAVAIKEHFGFEK